MNTVCWLCLCNCICIFIYIWWQSRRQDHEYKTVIQIGHSNRITISIGSNIVFSFSLLPSRTLSLSLSVFLFKLLWNVPPVFFTSIDVHALPFSFHGNDFIRKHLTLSSKMNDMVHICPTIHRMFIEWMKQTWQVLFICNLSTVQNIIDIMLKSMKWFHIVYFKCNWVEISLQHRNKPQTFDWGWCNALFLCVWIYVFVLQLARNYILPNLPFSMALQLNCIILMWNFQIKVPSNTAVNYKLNCIDCIWWLDIRSKWQ